jgi:hypothetical protein
MNFTETAAVTRAQFKIKIFGYGFINPLTPELNSSTQRCMTRFFTGDFAS